MEPIFDKELFHDVNVDRVIEFFEKNPQYAVDGKRKPCLSLKVYSQSPPSKLKLPFIELSFNFMKPSVILLCHLRSEVIIDKQTKKPRFNLILAGSLENMQCFVTDLEDAGFTVYVMDIRKEEHGIVLVSPLPEEKNSPIPHPHLCTVCGDQNVNITGGICTKCQNDIKEKGIEAVI